MTSIVKTEVQLYAERRQHEISATTVPEVTRAEVVREYFANQFFKYTDVNYLLRQENNQWTFGSRATFYRFLNKEGIEGPRKGAVRGIELMEKISQLPKKDEGRGFRGTHHALALQGVNTNRHAVLSTMQVFDHQGLQDRGLDSRKAPKRFPINMLGPNEQWSMDGHDKLANLGFGIYGIADVYSGAILSLRAFPNNRLAASVVWQYLVTVKDAGGIPLQTASDRGSETGLLVEAQTVLRNSLAPVSLADLPVHVFLKSTRNITIERFWRSVHKDVVVRFKSLTEEGFEHGFILTSPIHLAIYLWLFGPLVQKALDDHKQFHNTYKTSKQKKKMIPSGCRRIDAYQQPERFGGKQCLLPLDEQCKEMVERSIEENKGPAELKWVEEDVSNLLSGALVEDDLALEKCNEDNVWDFFVVLLRKVKDQLRIMV